MKRTRKPGQPGPKLSPEARQVLISRIVAGDSNPDILAYLERAGFPSDLTRATLAHYRNLPEVAVAISHIDVEFSQVALSVRGRRIKVLNDLVIRYVERLGLQDGHRVSGTFVEPIATGTCSLHDTKETSAAASKPEPAELTVREQCELSKGLVTAIVTLDKLLDSNASSQAGQPFGDIQGAIGGAAPDPRIETKSSQRALFNDILEEALREMEAEQASMLDSHRGDTDESADESAT